GSLMRWTSDLRPFASTAMPTFATVTVGLQAVEILRITQNQEPEVVRLEGPSAPSCLRSPGAVVVGDFTGDGTEDVLVEEPACGNWLAVATGDGFVPQWSSDILADPGPQQYADYLRQSE